MDFDALLIHDTATVARKFAGQIIGPSKLQREMQWGYNRAARAIESLILTDMAVADGPGPYSCKVNGIAGATNHDIEKEVDDTPQGRDNPFFSGFHQGQAFYTVDAKDRLTKVKEFTLEQCQAALKIKHLQATVVKAVEARIRKLNKQELPHAG